MSKYKTKVIKSYWRNQLELVNLRRKQKKEAEANK